MEELTQLLLPKTENLRKYEERVNQCKINRIFVPTQKRVVNEKEHERNAEWLRELRVKKYDMKQNEMNINRGDEQKSKKDPELEKARTRWSSLLLAEGKNNITRE